MESQATWLVGSWLSRAARNLLQFNGVSVGYTVAFMVPADT